MLRTKRIKLVIFETHPVQYRTPVYARLEQLCSGSFHVVYASDFSVRGGQDPGFGQSISWDNNLLAGYPFTVLRKDLVKSPSSWADLDGRGVGELLRILNPQAILIHSLRYRFDHSVYLKALMLRIPIWLRCETQDNAFTRNWAKSALRSSCYRLIYGGIQQAFPIGKLNRKHLLNHGFTTHKLRFNSHYCTPDRVGILSHEDLVSARHRIRDLLGVSPQHLVVSFFGKLIPKKNPLLLYECLPFFKDITTTSLSLLFVGNGVLRPQLEYEADKANKRYGLQSFFSGFINQVDLVEWYLASDIVVLPSRRQGETWGLVANEALQAGCAVVVSDAVGCAADFSCLERFRIIPEGSAEALALSLVDLSGFQRSFTWAQADLCNYSVEAAAQSLATAISELP
jgi:glycosyltransferase involved in cell wall biosynthesis